jgi:hypothetical protein
LRFNGDSGNNYWTHHIHAEAINGAQWTDVQNPSTNLIRLAESDCRCTRNVMAQINNRLGTSKTVNIKNQSGTNDPSVIGSVNVGGGEWVNTTSQITQIEMLTPEGNNMGTGSGFAVYGTNF